MIREPLPEPEQISEYLHSHGWTGENPLPADGEIFTFSELSDDGEPITVLVPGSSSVVFYPLRVWDILVTVAGMEERSEEEVRADILAEMRNVKSAGTHLTNAGDSLADNIPVTGKP
jgi:hypothetical protein